MEGAGGVEDGVLAELGVDALDRNQNVLFGATEDVKEVFQQGKLMCEPNDDGTLFKKRNKQHCTI